MGENSRAELHCGSELWTEQKGLYGKLTKGLHQQIYRVCEMG